MCAVYGVHCVEKIMVHFWLSVAQVSVKHHSLAGLTFHDSPEVFHALFSSYYISKPAATAIAAAIPLQVQLKMSCWRTKYHPITRLLCYTRIFFFSLFVLLQIGVAYDCEFMQFSRENLKMMRERMQNLIRYIGFPCQTENWITIGKIINKFLRPTEYKGTISFGLQHSTKIP